MFARNLTREIEVFLPLVALFQPRMLLPGLPAWGAVAGVVWIGAFALLPLLAVLLTAELAIRLVRAPLHFESFRLLRIDQVRRGYPAARDPMLGYVPEAGFEAMLGRFLQDVDPDIRQAAARAMRLLPSERAIGWLDLRRPVEPDADVGETLEEELAHHRAQRD